MSDTVKYFGKSFEVPYIEEGLYLPVGGTNQLRDETDIRVLVDGDGLESLVGEMRDTAPKYDRAKLKEWLESGEIDVDENLFATLYAFTNVYGQRVGFESDPTKRSEMYREGSPRLSDVITGKAAECAEIAAVAQLYLQGEGVDSTYFSGEVLWNREQEFAGAHTFVPLKFNGQEYIFDPANPHKTTSGEAEVLMPRIHKVTDFRDKVGQGKKAFVETTSVLGQSTAWYGVGNGTNVSEKDFVE